MLQNKFPKCLKPVNTEFSPPFTFPLQVFIWLIRLNYLHCSFCVIKGKQNFIEPRISLMLRLENNGIQQNNIVHGYHPRAFHYCRWERKKWTFKKKKAALKLTDYSTATSALGRKWTLSFISNLGSLITKIFLKRKNPMQSYNWYYSCLFMKIMTARGICANEMLKINSSMSLCKFSL